MQVVVLVVVVIACNVLFSVRAGVVYALEDGFVFWHRSSASLHQLSGLGCWVLLGLDQGLSADQLNQEYQISHPETLASVDVLSDLIAQVQAILLSNDGVTAQYREEYKDVLAAGVHTDRLDEGIRFRAGMLNIQLISQASAFTHSVSSLFAHELCSPILGDIDCQFEVIERSSDCYRLLCNGQALNNTLTAAQLMPVLMDYIQIIGYQSHDYLLAVHAAVVVSKGQALILPGLSGAGKSTLCVSLVQQGYACYSDELAVLGEPKGVVQPLPLPMAVKRGSWPLLQTDWPALKTAEIWRRPDGRELKYLHLPSTAYPDQHTPVTHQHVIFPQYDASCQTAELRTLTPGELLQQLTQVGYQVKSVLDQGKVERLLAFVHSTPAHSIRYASLDDAHALLNTLQPQRN